MNKRGEDSGISLIGFIEKSCGNPKDYSKILKEIPYKLFRKKLWQFETGRVAH